MQPYAKDYETKEELGILQLSHAAKNLGYHYYGGDNGYLSYLIGRTCLQLSNYLRFGEPYARNTARMLRELADKIEGPVKIDIKEIYGED